MTHCSCHAAHYVNHVNLKFLDWLFSWKKKLIDSHKQENKYLENLGHILNNISTVLAQSKELKIKCVRGHSKNT